MPNLTSSRYKAIPLTQNKFTIIDAEDFKWLSQWKWHVVNNRDTYFYAIRSNRKVNGIRLKPQHLFMHRVITKCPKGFIVDHKNRNSLDNRRVNLRVCRFKDNSRNSKIPITNTSGFKGVYFNKKDKKWQAYIHINNKTFYLGMWENKLKAAQAYNEAAKKNFGEFARLNKY